MSRGTTCGEKVTEEEVVSHVEQGENRRRRDTERPLHLVTGLHWWPMRTKVNPERYSLVSKAKSGRDFKFIAESAKKDKLPLRDCELNVMRCTLGRAGLTAQNRSPLAQA